MKASHAEDQRSMDGILSSIRQTIEDEFEDSGVERSQKAGAPNVFDISENLKARQEREQRKMKSAVDENEVLELTQMIREDGSIVDIREEQKMVSKSKKENEKPEGETIEAQEVPEGTAKEVGVQDPVELGPKEDLISEGALSESSAALAGLASVAKTMIQTTGRPLKPESVGGMTVESLMRELLRPMLKDWLDSHLPSLVKWLVTEQIEKMLQQSGIDVSQKSGGAEGKASGGAAPEAAAEVTEESNTEKAAEGSEDGAPTGGEAKDESAA